MARNEDLVTGLDDDRLWYIRMLQSNECLCGREKKPRHAFCYACYSALPGDVAALLYAQIGQGYEPNFEEAVKWLQENRW
jgi:hypothetical protein